MKLGMYQGCPTKICPHATSGRADYFGSLVNRCGVPRCGVLHGACSFQNASCRVVCAVPTAYLVHTSLMAVGLAGTQLTPTCPTRIPQPHGCSRPGTRHMQGLALHALRFMGMKRVLGWPAWVAARHAVRHLWCDQGLSPSPAGTMAGSTVRSQHARPGLEPVTARPGSHQRPAGGNSRLPHRLRRQPMRAGLRGSATALRRGAR